MGRGGRGEGMGLWPEASTPGGHGGGGGGGGGMLIPALGGQGGLMSIVGGVACLYDRAPG
ncbi:hypothetical protein WJX73_003960, partial [Symbiochloris irregularis]